MVRVLVIYDISNDRVRLKVSEACLDYGLDRAQFSVFTGMLKTTHIRQLAKELRRLAGDGQVMILPIGAEDWERRVVIGEASR